MDIHDVKKKIDSEDVTLIDVRAEADYEKAHIENAINVSDNNIDEFIEKADKEKTVICYCYHGISSEGAKTYLEQHGFAEVHSMDGGFEEWKFEYPVVNGTDA